MAAQWTKSRFPRCRTMNFQIATPPRVFKIFSKGLLQSLHTSSGYKTTQPFFWFLASNFPKIFFKKLNFQTPKNPLFCQLGPFHKFLRTKIKKVATYFCSHQICEEIKKKIVKILKTVGGVGIWMSKIYAKTRFGRHVILDVVKLGYVTFSIKNSKFRVLLWRNVI